MSTEKQRTLWAAYKYNNRIYLRREVERLQDNLRCRDVGVVDCLELALALERLAAFDEYVSHTEAIFGLCLGSDLKKS